MRLRMLLLIVLLFYISFSSEAQQFGGSPGLIKWRQVNNDTVRVIFPQSVDSIAQRIATVVTGLQRNNYAAIGSKISKVNIVLQSDVTLSNAYVGLGPYRSEFYLMPPVNAFELGAQNWADNLAIHEFRHVQQYSNFRKGLSKTMYVLFGEDGQALANGAAIPDWFFEGDAVYNETLLSMQGRGRLPDFFAGYRSLYNSSKQYSYMKLRNGSYLDYTPSHYQLGYLLVAYGREKYGTDFWQKVTSEAVRFKPLFYPLQGAIKKFSGLSFDNFVNNAFSYYKQQWDNTSDSLQWFSASKKETVEDYRYPYATNDGGLIVLKTSYKKIPAIYTLKDGIETKLKVRDIAYDDYFSYNNGKVVYASFQPDARWGNRNYSVIKLLDVKSGSEKRITSHTKYFCPDISHEGTMIATTEITASQHSAIKLLDTQGNIIRTLLTSDSLIYTYPKFSDNDSSLYVIARNKAGQMSLQEINIATTKTTTLLPFANRIIGFPAVNGDTLTYTCSNNGNDEAWAYIGATQTNYRLASYSTGLYQSCFLPNGKLISSAFTADGYRLAVVPLSKQSIDVSDTLVPLYVTKPFQSNANSFLANTNTKVHTISKYPKLFHPFNFHSWRPDFNDPDYGFTIYGENVLNTIQNQISYTYNRNEGYNSIGYSLVYGGFYLQPFLGISETFHRKAQYNIDTSFYWNEFKSAAGLQLPLNLSGGKYYRYLTLSSSFNLNKVNYTGLAKQLIPNRNINYVQARLVYSSQIQKARQQIYPHWAQSLVLQYRRVTNNYTGRQLLASGNFYLPGLLNNHSLVLSAAYQSRDTINDYTFTNSFPFSRGYTSLNYPRLYKLGANYHFPLVYPDWGFANIVYFLRVRGNVFYDYTNAKSVRTGKHFTFSSTGAELYFDTRWWNQQPITFGLRYSRLLNANLTRQSPNQFDFIVPLNLLN